MGIKAKLLAAAVAVSLSGQAFAGAILAGFDSNTLARNDDGSTGLVNIGFNVNFFGLTFSQLFVNNNGNITFDAALSAFTPFGLTNTNRQIIAPFFADVDTRLAGDEVTYGTGSFNGRAAFGVNWINVDYFQASTAHTNRNSFQLLLVERADTGAGNFDIIFNYDEILWETGTHGSSGGDANGRGGNSARAGFSNGTGQSGSFYELTGSAVNGALLNGGSHALISNSLNSGIDGRYIFTARDGDIDVDPVPVPEPASLALLGLGLLGFGLQRRKTRA